MNDLLKALSKSLQPLGYHVRPRIGLNFLRVPALENDANSENVTAVRKAMDNTVRELPEGNLNAMTIYLRTCLRTNRNINPRPRLTGPDQAENAYRCIWSLVRAVNCAVKYAPGLQLKLIVLDDRSDADAKARIASLVTKAKVETEIKTTTEAGQGQSLYQQFKEARDENAIVYCVEDDYLHEEEAIIRLWQFYAGFVQKAGSHVVLYPQEHNELYSNHYPSYVVQGSDCHWRSIRHATHTFMTHGKVIQKYWKYFENTKHVGNKKKRKLGSEARTTNKLFQKIPGFSPLRPAAIHLQYEELLPPFYDWRMLWDMNVPPAP